MTTEKLDPLRTEAEALLRGAANRESVESERLYRFATACLRQSAVVVLAKRVLDGGEFMSRRVLELCELVLASPPAPPGSDDEVQDWQRVAAVETKSVEAERANGRTVVRMLFDELLDETVPAGELVRFVRSVRQSIEEGDTYDESPMDDLAKRLTGELFGDSPVRVRPLNPGEMALLKEFLVFVQTAPYPETAEGWLERQAEACRRWPLAAEFFEGWADDVVAQTFGQDARARYIDARAKPLKAGRSLPPVGFFFCPICERNRRLTQPCKHITITEGYRPKLVEMLRKLEMADSVCRECGCTDEDCSRCVAKTGVPCHWVEQDLCSACAPEERSG